MKDKNVHPDKQKEIEQRNLERLRKEKLSKSDWDEVRGVNKSVYTRKHGAIRRK